MEYEIQGYTSGTGAVMRVFGGGFAFRGFNNFCVAQFTFSYLFDSCSASQYGKGYNTEGDVTAEDYLPPDPLLLIIPPKFVRTPDTNVVLTEYTFGLPGGGKNGANKYHWEKAAVIQLFSGGDSRNPGAGAGYPIAGIDIIDPGAGCLVAPEIKIISNSGFGAYATCTVKDGRINTVTLENPGGGYTSPPEVKLMVGGAEAFPVARPHLRGLYQCYYRYTDDTPEEKGGPVPRQSLGSLRARCWRGRTKHNLGMDAERADEPCDTRRTLEEHERPSNNDVPSSTGYQYPMELQVILMT